MSVIYIYGFRYPKTLFRYLVLALSFVDFTSCCSTVPMETVSTWFWFDAPSVGLCKAKNFFVQFTGLSAMYMLFVTAVCKYRHICKPFGKRIRPTTVIILSGCGIFGSLVCATPAAILWGINNHTIPIGNVSQLTLVCEVQSEYHHTLYPALYRHLLSAYDVFLLATIVLYIFVARAAVMHVLLMKKLQKAPDGLSMSRKCSVTVNSQILYVADNILQSDTIQNGRVFRIRRQSSLTARRQNSITTVTISRPNRRIRPIQIRKVIIMVIIAGTFSVTCLMALAFGYVFAIRNIEEYSSVGELVLLFCCYRFYFINYAMNPVVYFCLDLTYRKKVIKLLKCC